MIEVGGGEALREELRETDDNAGALPLSGRSRQVLNLVELPKQVDDLVHGLINLVYGLVGRFLGILVAPVAIADPSLKTTDPF